MTRENTWYNLPQVASARPGSERDRNPVTEGPPAPWALAIDEAERVAGVVSQLLARGNFAGAAAAIEGAKASAMAAARAGFHCPRCGVVATSDGSCRQCGMPTELVRDDARDKSVFDEFDTRTANMIFEQLGCATLGELLAIDDRTLLATPNISEKTRLRVDGVLFRYGLERQRSDDEGSA